MMLKDTNNKNKKANSNSSAKKDTVVTPIANMITITWMSSDPSGLLSVCTAKAGGLCEWSPCAPHRGCWRLGLGFGVWGLGQVRV